MDTPGTYDNLLSEFYKDPVVRARDVQIPDGAELDSIDVYCDYAESSDYYVNLPVRFLPPPSPVPTALFPFS